LNLFYNKHRVKQATYTTVITLNITVMHKLSHIHYAQILHAKTHYKTSCDVSSRMEEKEVHNSIIKQTNGVWE
jgi:hypothetical protein